MLALQAVALWAVALRAVALHAVASRARGCKRKAFATPLLQQNVAANAEGILQDRHRPMWLAIHLVCSVLQHTSGL